MAMLYSSSDSVQKRDVNFDGLTITAKAPRLPLQYCSEVTLRGMTCLPPQED